MICLRIIFTLFPINVKLCPRRGQGGGAARGGLGFNFFHSHREAYLEIIYSFSVWVKKDTFSSLLLFLTFRVSVLRYNYQGLSSLYSFVKLLGIWLSI